MSDLKWYVLKSISGQENKVKTYIENEMKRLGFEHFVTQVVIPMEKVIQMRNGKKVPKEKPYYPGYLMVEANLIGEIPHIIKNIPGVISFLSLGFRNKPSELDNGILQIQLKTDTSANGKHCSNII